MLLLKSEQIKSRIYWYQSAYFDQVCLEISVRWKKIFSTCIQSAKSECNSNKVKDEIELITYLIMNTPVWIELI